MQLKFPESEIPKWASQYSCPEEETDLMQQRNTVLRQGHLTKDQLILLARWKSPRSAPHILRNPSPYVTEVTKFSLGTHDERAKIESLTILDGVLWPTASVILHLFHTDAYPLLDFRALWSINESAPNSYTFSFWWQYVQFCRDVADRAGTDMRTLDRALWQFSKIHQPKGGTSQAGT